MDVLVDFVLLQLRLEFEVAAVGIAPPHLVIIYATFQRFSPPTIPFSPPR